jgi:hypothetical protein
MNHDRLSPPLQCVALFSLESCSLQNRLTLSIKTRHRSLLCSVRIGGIAPSDLAVVSLPIPLSPLCGSPITPLPFSVSAGSLHSALHRRSRHNDPRWFDANWNRLIGTLYPFFYFWLSWLHLDSPISSIIFLTFSLLHFFFYFPFSLNLSHLS